MAWTDEQRKEWGRKMRAARLAKQEQSSQNLDPRGGQAKQSQAARSTESTPASQSTEPATPTVDVTSADDSDEETTDVKQDRISKLEAQIELLLKMQGAKTEQPNASAKTVDKYSTNLSLYASPVESLMAWAAQDRRMLQQGFLANYELQFVSEIPPRYQLADKSWERQPKFTLGLLELAYDDDGNVLTRVNERGETVQIKYLRKRLVYFEDPDNALAIAHRKGLELDDETSQSFLNDMRYLQAQEWLLEVFYPPKPSNSAQLREEAIGGQMVTIVESPTQFSKIDPAHKLRV